MIPFTFDNERPAILGYATCFHCRSSNTAGIVLPGAFADSIKSNRLWTATIQHIPGLILAAGYGIQFAEDETGLLCLIQPRSTELSTLVIESMRQGHFVGMSLTYDHSPSDIRLLSNGNRAYYGITKANVTEVCLTDSPAVQQTRARLVGKVPTGRVDATAPSRLYEMVRTRLAGPVSSYGDKAA